MSRDKRLMNHYRIAREYVIDAGYDYEINVVKARKFGDQTSRDLFMQYVYVVLNSGMKNQVAERIISEYFQIGVSAIKHPKKRDAIKRAENEFLSWFESLKLRETVDEQLEFLELLPMIGPVTKYHLARNLGIDVAKPDRHLLRLAEYFGYDDVQVMCSFLAECFHDRIGVVDVVLWRYANLTGGTINI